MKKLLLFLSLVMLMSGFYSCSDTETYAEKRDKENAAISQFLSRNLETSKLLFRQPVSVISETDFERAGFKTDTMKNEFVLFESSGVYMQIMRQGCGEKIKSGETANVLCRFKEYNLLIDSLQLTNELFSTNYYTDKMSVTNYYGTFTGSFDQAWSLMAYRYSSTSVPAGWLVPLRYVNVGRQSKPDEEIAKVRIIVPSAQGQYSASTTVYPCFYELTYQRGD